MISINPEWVEPSFKIYYFDMVYSYPIVLEVDLVLFFKHGFICLEMEKEVRNLHKFLKYFVNGVSGYPVLYRCQSPDIKSIGTMTPTLIYKDLKLSDLVEEQYETYLEKLRLLKTQRYEFFSIDNFMCALLIYGSPKICESLLESNIMKDTIENSKLLTFRKNLISLVKFGKNRDSSTLILSSEKVSNPPTCLYNLNVKTLIIPVPTIEAGLYYDKIGKALTKILCEAKLDNIVLIYTEASRKDAMKIDKLLKNIVKDESIVKSEEVRKDKITETIEKYVEEMPKDILVMLIGEMPKRELIKLATTPNIRIGVLTWRPVYNMEKIEKLKKCVDEECSIPGGLEELELLLLKI